MNYGFSGKPRPILLGSIVLLLTLSSVVMLRGSAISTSAPPVDELGPTLSYHLVNGDSQIEASLTFYRGCFSISNWGTPVESGNSFSVNTTVADSAGRGIFCTQAVFGQSHNYNLGRLSSGNYNFTFSACIVFSAYGGVVDCSNKASVSFRAPTLIPSGLLSSIFGPFAVVIIIILRSLGMLVS